MTHLTYTTRAMKFKDIKRFWHLINIEGKILGRVSTTIAKYLVGKHKVNYVPYLDVGDYVVVINAQKVAVSGRKLFSKVLTSYSGYPGGLKKERLDEIFKKKPEYLIKHAVSGMLPKNKMRDDRLARLYVYTDEKHPFSDKFKSQNSQVKSTMQK